MDMHEQEAVIAGVKKVLTGKDGCIKKAFAAILAGGHVRRHSETGTVGQSLYRKYFF